MKSARFTLRAEARLNEISQWTLDLFGPEQAARYEAALTDGVEELQRGTLTGRDCRLLAPGGGVGDDLRYVRIGAHYLIFLESADEIGVVDLVHGSRDLEAILKELSDARDER